MVEEQKTFFKSEVLQLESLGDSVVRVSVGEVGVGKITELNGQPLTTLKLHQKELLHLLCSTTLENIMIDGIRQHDRHEGPLEVDTSSSMAAAADKDEDDFIICYRQIPDGIVGATLERVNAVDNDSNDGYDFLTGALEVVDKSVKCTTLSIGEIIVAINGISLLQMTAENAISLLSSTSNRRLTILRKHTRFSPAKKRTKHSLDETSTGTRRKEETCIPSPQTPFIFLASPSKQATTLSSPYRSRIKEPETNLEAWREIRSRYINRTLHRGGGSSTSESDELRSAFNNQDTTLLQKLVRDRIYDFHKSKV